MIASAIILMGLLLISVIKPDMKYDAPLVFSALTIVLVDIILLAKKMFDE